VLAPHTSFSSSLIFLFFSVVSDLRFLTCVFNESACFCLLPSSTCRFLVWKKHQSTTLD
jgi:hypothetical protein